MCGIAGFLGKGDEGDLLRMTNTIKHRGPDDHGVWFRGGVGLGHTRLSILDLSPLGHQPMISATQKTVIVFNGEIYNFQDLKALVPRYPFRGGSDTEVLLALYEAYGEKMFSLLSGMFALAIYDIPEAKLILARDPVGKKPLYCGDFGGTIVFGSELKALLSHPEARKEVDTFAVSQYLLLDFVPTPRSIFKNIKKVEPGSYVVFHSKKKRAARFWDIPKETDISIPFSSALKRVDELLAASVEKRLISDVPLGVFLSGGLDSSAVAYYAKKLKPDLKTFSISFDDRSFDESQFAYQVSRYLGTDHYSERVTAKDLLDVVPRVPELFDEPVADASVIPTFLLSKFARRSVSVALGGDGGDELFAGYPTFQAEKLVPFLKQFTPLGRVLSGFVREGTGYLSLGFKMRKFFDGVEVGAVRRHLAWLGNGVGSKELLDQFGQEFNEWGNDPGNRLLALYMRTYLMDQVLVKVDRASMAHALEVRAPLLDRELLEYVFTLPYGFKQHGFTGKYLLKKIMDGVDERGKRRLPKDIVHRSKHGFAIPLAVWLRRDLKEWAWSVLSSSSLQELGVDVLIVEKLWQEHQSGERDHRKRLWNLIVLSLWHKKWVS